MSKSCLHIRKGIFLLVIFSILLVREAGGEGGRRWSVPIMSPCFSGFVALLVVTL